MRQFKTYTGNNKGTRQQLCGAGSYCPILKNATDTQEVWAHIPCVNARNVWITTFENEAIASFEYLEGYIYNYLEVYSGDEGHIALRFNGGIKYQGHIYFVLGEDEHHNYTFHQVDKSTFEQYIASCPIVFEGLINFSTNAETQIAQLLIDGYVTKYGLTVYNYSESNMCYIMVRDLSTSSTHVPGCIADFEISPNLSLLALPTITALYAAIEDAKDIAEAALRECRAITTNFVSR